MRKKYLTKGITLILALALTVTSQPLRMNAKAEEPAANYEEANIPAAAVTASSARDGHGPELVIDGIHNEADNNWVPEQKPTASASQWLQLDFGKTVKVGVLEAAVTGNQGPKSYEIQASSDGQNFVKVFDKTVESSRTIFAQWNAVDARYLRLVIRDSFQEICAVNELTAFPDILPHRVGVLAGFPDMGNFGDKGLEALHRQGQQMVNLCVSISDPASPGINILPDLIDDGKFPDGLTNDEVMEYVSNPDNYSWEYADWIFGKFIDDGFDIWLGFQGFSERAFPEFYTDIVDEDGRVVKHRDFFNDIQNQAVIEIAKQTMLHFDSNPHIRAYSILGPGWFGGIEFYSGSNPERLAVYSEGAQNKFRSWLQDKYKTVEQLNSTWNTSYGDFDSVVVPKPVRNNAQAVDDRPEWADLMIWKIQYMDDFINLYMTTMRSVSDKPIHVEIDGGYQSAPMETGESMGKIVRDFSKYDNVIVGNSNLDASYGPAQFSATADFYQMDGVTMDDTGQLDEKKQLDNGFNFLSRGIGTLAHCSLGADFSEYSNGSWDKDGEYSGTDVYHYTKNNAKKILAIDPEGAESDVVVFNPWYANLFRQGYNKNNHNYVFDSEHGIQWYGAAFANWAHYLNSPVILDDFPVQDGALAGKKVLIEPNMDVALTTNEAETQIKQWIEEGGAFAGFGKDCFNYSFNTTTGRLEGGDSVEEWMMGLSGGAQVTNFTGSKVEVSKDAPEWLKSVSKGAQAGYECEDPVQKKAFSRLTDGAVPVLVDEAGNIVMCEWKVGEGSVLFCTVPIANTEMFQDGFMSKILADYADSRGITRTVTYDPLKFHVVDAGLDQLSGRRVLEVSRNENTKDSDLLIIEQDGSLDGKEAVIDLNWKKDELIYHKFEEGKAFVYSDSASGEISGSAVITRENGKTIITMDLGYDFAVESVILDAENKVESIQFKEGGFAPEWTVSGSAFGNAPVSEDGELTASSRADSTGVGKISSKLFTIEDNVLGFYGTGYAGVKPSKGEEEPSQTPEPTQTPEPPQTEEPIVVADFADGDWSELESVDTAVFGDVPASGASDKGWDGYFATSGAIDEKTTGSLRTKTFIIERKQLTFLDMGYCGPAYDPDKWTDYAAGGGNVFRLVDAQTGDVLIEEQPVNVFGREGVTFEDFREHVMDVSTYQGREVYFEMSDAIAGGFGWFGMANLRQTDPDAGSADTSRGSANENVTVIADFEDGTWSQTVNIDTTVFGDAPSTSGVPNGTGYYAYSAAVSGENKGTLRTNNFIVERPFLTFKGAGWNGTAYSAGDWPYQLNNRFYLKDAATDEILIEQVPENRLGDSDKFMTYSWDVNEYAGREVYFEMVDAVGKEEAAVYGGGFDWIAVDDIILTGDKFDSEPEAGGYNAYYLKDVTGNILRTAYPSDSGDQKLVTWDVSALKGQQVYFEAVDGMDSAENGWIGFHELFTYNYKDAPEDDYWSFESGTYDGWERSGNAFPAQANSSKLGRPMGDDNGVYWADSNVGGEDKTGTLTSKEFVIEKPFLSFLACGWNGQNGWDPAKNYYELIGADGTQLRMATPPGQSSQPLNQFIRQYWDVSELMGQTVRFRMVDGDSGTGYAWMALDSIRQEYNFNFENGTFVSWNMTGDAFGAAPVTASQDTDCTGARGEGWADSAAGGPDKTGTLTSEPFVMENDTISFLAAGYGVNGNNYFRLLNEAGEEIARAVPPEDDNFVMLTMTAEGYQGKNVIFEAVDGSTEQKQGWIALDDLNFRFLFPDTVRVLISSGNDNWTEAAALDMRGKTRAAADLAENLDTRYIRFELSREDVDLNFLNLVQIKQNNDAQKEDLTVAEGIADLGSIKSFKTMTANFAGETARNFTVSVSKDGEVWRRIYQALDGRGSSYDISTSKVNGRYIRFEGDIRDLQSVTVYTTPATDTEPDPEPTPEPTPTPIVSPAPNPSGSPEPSAAPDPTGEPVPTRKPDQPKIEDNQKPDTTQSNDSDSNAHAPQTGDEAPVIPYVLLLVGMAALAAGGIVVKKKRSKA